MSGHREPDGHPTVESPNAKLASDIVTFGQEIGRVLSDGRIIGRAEPYAKVFPSSRAVKRAVGVVAWAVLEDIALDARIDDRGRLVAATNVRRIAANLGMSKNAVARHLARLREHGFVLHEEQRHAGSGRYGSSWYVLDPSACLERFTTTPTAPRPSDGDTAVDEAASSPCPTSGDTGPVPSVSPSTGHRDMGHNNKTTPGEEHHQHQTAREADGDLVERLVVVGVDGAVAARLVVDHGADAVESALAALPWHRVRNPAGWLVRAVHDGWIPAARRQPTPIRTQQAAEDRASVEPDGLAHEAWAAFAVAVLNDADLAAVVARVTEPVDGLGRRSLPLTIAQLGAWAARAFVSDHAAGSLREALTDQLDAATPVPADTPVSCVELPQVEVPADWKDRLQIAMSAEVAA